MDKTMRLIHEQTIKRVSTQEGGPVMKQSTAEARDMINRVRGDHGETFEAMDKVLEVMIGNDDRDGLLLYSGRLQRQLETIYRYIRNVKEE